MYRLDNTFARGLFTVTVVGCGGTGGFVAEGMARLLPPRARLALVDHDRVEEGNLGRQSFTHDDIGRFKSAALAERLARRYRRPVAYSVLPVALAGIAAPGLVLGCVDNGPARRDMATGMKGSSVLGLPSVGYVSRPNWWVDAGNGENYGQVLIGNSPLEGLRGAFDPETGVCSALPLPTLQRPELLAQRPPAPDCAGAVVLGEQGPAINQAMAALVVELARRLIDGTCPWMGLHLDLEAGTLGSTPATPEAVERLTGISRRKLLQGRR
ncbi:MAG: ThiF family adenylyltransferase [Chloroflexi bacterium]|nr:ThiF family adenylyltransferase [Chloroflexota bacterium]